MQSNFNWEACPRRDFYFGAPIGTHFDPDCRGVNGRGPSVRGFVSWLQAGNLPTGELGDLFIALVAKRGAVLEKARVWHTFCGALSSGPWKTGFYERAVFVWWEYVAVENERLRREEARKLKAANNKRLLASSRPANRLAA